MSSPSPGAGQAARAYPARPAAVYFYATCLVDMFVPEAGMDAITLLEREGFFACPASGDDWDGPGEGAEADE